MNITYAVQDVSASRRRSTVEIELTLRDFFLLKFQGFMGGVCAAPINNAPADAGAGIGTSEQVSVAVDDASTRRLPVDHPSPPFPPPSPALLSATHRHHRAGARAAPEVARARAAPTRRRSTCDAAPVTAQLFGRRDTIAFAACAVRCLQCRARIVRRLSSRSRSCAACAARSRCGCR